MGYQKNMSPAQREAYNAYMRRYMLDRYYRRRAAAIAQLGGKCIDCGATEELELDHVDRETKSFDIGKALSSWSDTRIRVELAKCVIRCASCHQAKTARELGWQVHGSYSMYKRRDCRCEICVTEFRRKANAASRRRRERKRESENAGS